MIKWFRKIRWSTFYWPAVWFVGALFLYGVAIILASIPGCATLEKVGNLIGFGRTIQANNIEYHESPFGWSLAAIFFFFKLWFWYQNHCKKKRLDKLYRVIESSCDENKSVDVQMLKSRIAFLNDEAINRRVEKLFPNKKCCDHEDQG